MVSIGNKAILARSEQCQKCANCCKEFTCGGFDTDIATRFLWMSKSRIYIREAELKDDIGNTLKDIVFPFRCEKLACKKGKYSCSVWNEQRPDFCNTYPDSIFYPIDVGDTIKIQKLLEHTRKHCPALKKVTVKQVQEMLKKYRKKS